MSALWGSSLQTSMIDKMLVAIVAIFNIPKMYCVRCSAHQDQTLGSLSLCRYFQGKDSLFRLNIPNWLAVLADSAVGEEAAVRPFHSPTKPHLNSRNRLASSLAPQTRQQAAVLQLR